MRRLWCLAGRASTIQDTAGKSSFADQFGPGREVLPLPSLHVQSQQGSTCPGDSTTNSEPMTSSQQYPCVTWCDLHQVQDTCDHTIHKQAFPYTAGIHSGSPTLSVLSTQVNHIRQTDRHTHAYTNTAGTHPSYQGQSTPPLPYHPKYVSLCRPPPS